MNPFSEDNLIEKTAIKIFGELWGTKNFINAYSDEGDALLGRDNQGQVVLINRLKFVLQKLNADTPQEAIDRAIDELTRDRSAMSKVNANAEIYKLIKDGVKIEVKDEHGAFETINIKVIDFNDSTNNDFLLVSQMWITSDLYTKRPDLIGFVNGLPLVLIELKACHKNLRNAYDENITDYKDTIPQLFWYNAFIIISNGIESKVGTLSSDYEYFNEWKKIEDENEEGVVSIETLLKGICHPSRLLDIVENFTLFDCSRGELTKIIARYFQFLGVNRAFQRVVKRDEHGGRLGVFWHTQGSGKSYSMIFLSQKIFRKLYGNFTFIIVTDRKELDKQIYKNFVDCGTETNEVHAESVQELRELLNEDHRHIFTLIQKFNAPFELNRRSDIIVMADEAHRTQYDIFAKNLRIALPNASFIGFTGTPLMTFGEEKTKSTFGDYVSTYNFAQSIADGATVPLYYENRVPSLENANPKIQEDIEKVLDYYELDGDEEDKLQREFSTFYHLITREDRLNKIAEDIIEHFTSRGYHGKAMVVSIDKKTAIRMYVKVQEQMARYLAKLNIALSKAVNEYERMLIQAKISLYEEIDMAVVVSQSQNEIADMEKFEIDMRPIRARMANEDLEKKFKDPNDNLKIIFVCGMWMTGFDVPNLSTLYLDKPLKNHTLMQTISRANRVYPGKMNGLIVDYIGVFRNIQKALAVYAINKQGLDSVIEDKDVLVEILITTIQSMHQFLTSIELDINVLLKAQNVEKIHLVDVFTNRILQDEQSKQRYLELASDLHDYYNAILPEPKAEDYFQEVTAYKIMALRIREIMHGDADFSQIKSDLDYLLDRSIRAGKYSIGASKLKDLSELDFQALNKFFNDSDTKNIATEELKAELEKKIKEMVKKNKLRKSFLDRLSSLLKEYNSGSCDREVFFNQLVDLAQDLSEEERRTIYENLTEEELAIFDLLRKDNLNPDETDQVKKVAKELVLKIKTEKLVLDWKKKTQAQAELRVTIRNLLLDNLPEPAYSDSDCAKLTQNVYLHIYDSYLDANVNSYMG